MSMSICTSTSRSRLRPPTTADLEGKGKIATLGMLIIDQFETSPTADIDLKGKQVEEAIGGGGVYAMIGSRMFLPSRHIALIVDKGEDFPEAFVDLLKPLQGGIYWRDRAGKTTRALNVYSGGKIGEGHQSFRYLVPTKQINLSDLLYPPSPFSIPQLSPEAEACTARSQESGRGIEWVHVVVRNTRARAIVSEREGLWGVEGKGWEGKMIWEPLDVMGEGRLSLEEWCDLAINFDIISPNLLELRSILYPPDPPTTTTTSRFSDTKQQAESDIHHLYTLLYQTSSRLHPDRLPPILICRAGAWGAYTISPKWTGWTPAFWRSEEVGKVVDPTGGGNGFLGGVGAGMILFDGDVRLAIILGSAAASFTIQQRGLPVYEQGSNGEGERWNGDDVWGRARVIEERMARSGT